MLIIYMTKSGQFFILPPSDGDETTESSNLWCSYDDDIVHVIDEKSVKTSAAYILFYRQRILCKK
jgi:hypothetical protein